MALDAMLHLAVVVAILYLGVALAETAGTCETGVVLLQVGAVVREVPAQEYTARNSTDFIPPLHANSGRHISSQINFGCASHRLCVYSFVHELSNMNY